MRTPVLLAALLAGLPPSVVAQADWTTVQQPATWVNAFADHAISERMALWFDGHWRRMDLGGPPQQVLLRPGVQVALRPGLRVGGGYAYIATAPYGESPNPAPLREHRVWQQLALAQSLGAVSVVHRLRGEQRWTAIVSPDDVVGPGRYQQRLRYFVRAQRTVSAKAMGFVANEVFVPVGHGDGRQRRLQNRAQVGLGIPLDERQRIEIGYLHQWSRLTTRETHEINHTLVLSWVWVQRRP